ncbi:hypothetical protein A1O1_06394 [Capronia coronata CBS 617.96]|uniref:Wax synthase domain-containing protein n=1 Tax=Capronia coronata CBS 617.96 TaxID=1182541 RepID=W9Y8R8_9EURO|nr:uncharacterized protein A1O1_06394 [Capronia coronata CBS 617.96]EXJ86025.1 hypothetical protein A1O1_06394 [Capronia coronata CBS 617.96]
MVDIFGMDPSWFPPTDRPIRLGGRYVLAANAIPIATLLLPHGYLRHSLAIPALLWIPYSLRQYTTGQTEEDYLTAINVCMALGKYIDFCILRTSEHACRRVAPDGSLETLQEITTLTLWQKLRWNFDLFTTMRGIGWNWRVKNVEEVARDIPRSRFILVQIFRVIYCFAFLDVYEWCIRRTSFGDGTRPIPDFFSVSLVQQILFAWAGALHSGFTMAFGYYFLAAITVMTGLSHPQSWPPMFGSFTQKGYTMRKVWGYCWHQFLRRTFETANSGITGLLRIKKGTLASRYLQLYAAFFVSALIHHVGSLNMPYCSMVWYQFLFFMMQPVAITVEDVVIIVANKVGLRESWITRIVGYAWVGCVLSFTLRYVIKAFVEAGLGDARHPFVARFCIMDRVYG